VSSSERDVVTMSGVDTAVYFVFLTTGFFLFPFFYLYICLLHNFLFVEAPRIKLGYGFIGSFWSCSPIKVGILSKLNFNFDSRIISTAHEELHHMLCSIRT